MAKCDFIVTTQSGGFDEQRQPEKATPKRISELGSILLVCRETEDEAVNGVRAVVEETLIAARGDLHRTGRAGRDPAA